MQSEMRRCSHAEKFIHFEISWEKWKHRKGMWFPPHRWCEASLLVQHPFFFILCLFVSQHRIIDLPSEAVPDVGESGSSQQGSILNICPLSALRLHQHVQGVKLSCKRARTILTEQRLHHQHSTSYSRDKNTCFSSFPPLNKVSWQSLETGLQNQKTK